VILPLNLAVELGMGNQYQSTPKVVDEYALLQRLQIVGRKLTAAY
jgi:hypothetical protein